MTWLHFKERKCGFSRQHQAHSCVASRSPGTSRKKRVLLYIVFGSVIEDIFVSL